MKNRRSRTSSEMYPLVQAYISGNQSRSVFCAAHNIPVSALNYWQTKYRKSQGLGKEHSPQNNFVSVELKPSSLEHVVMELELQRGSRLRFYSYPDPSYLESILSIQAC